MPKTVSLFVPCFVDQLQPQVAIDTVKVLRRIGYTVHFPEDQTCCGQPAFNSGFWDEARPCAERFLKIFGASDVIVCPSGSCTSMVKSHYPELLKDTPSYNDAVTLGQRVYELSQFLIRVAQISDVGSWFPHSVTYHASCHATRELGIHDEPLTLLKNVRGLELRSLPHEEDCCGFGGTFSTKFGMISAAMGDTKAGNIEATKAEYVTSIDPSCLIHLAGIIGHTRRSSKPIHLASILAQEAQ
ncbi:MAG TPA: (Fe-S)-binding protein [Terriglobales bacterium]|nr:(Fe-S)-binding protein [Terriglobales bacterium]